MEYKFTKLQILFAIANWELEPFTLEELNFLLKYFCTDTTNTYTYGENDIVSFILDILSEIAN